MTFKTKRTAPFRKLMKVYCDRQGAVEVGSLASSRSPLCLRPGNRVPATSQAGHEARTLRTGVALEQVHFLFGGKGLRCALLLC